VCGRDGGPRRAAHEYLKDLILAEGDIPAVVD
jgi:hypothetical protein